MSGDLSVDDKLRWLFENVGPVIPVKRCFGLVTSEWLSLFKSESHWWVFRTSHKGSHIRIFYGPAYAINVSKSGKVRAWEQVVTMWPIEDRSRNYEISQWLKGLVDKAYSFHIRR